MLSQQELKQIRTERERSFQDLSCKLDAMNRNLFEVLQQTSFINGNLKIVLDRYSILWIIFERKDAFNVRFSICFAPDKNRDSITTGEILLRQCIGPEKIQDYFEKYENVCNFSIDNPSNKQEFSEIIGIIQSMNEFMQSY